MFLNFQIFETSETFECPWMFCKIRGNSCKVSGYINMLDITSKNKFWKKEIVVLREMHFKLYSSNTYITFWFVNALSVKCISKNTSEF